MAVNKVVMNTENGAETLIDLTGDTVTPETLAEGTTAHDASGNLITGTTPTDVVRYGAQTLTEAQKAQARENIGAIDETKLAEELAKRGQLKTEFANDVSECTDTSKLYVLPDGYIYVCTRTEVEVEGGPAYTNVLPSAIMGTDQATGWVEGEGYTANARLSGSGGNVVTGYTTVEGVCSSGYIPVKVGDIVRIKNFYGPYGVSTYAVSYDNNKARLSNRAWGISNADVNYAWGEEKGAGNWYTVEGEKKPTGVTTFTITEANFGSGVAFLRISGVFGFNGEKMIVTVNEEIKNSSNTTVVEYLWQNTGHAFVPADYEDRIIKLEDNVKILAAGGSIPLYTNVLKTAIDADGSVYNGLGYKTGYRLNSSCAEVAATDRCCTGFIAVNPNDTVRLKNISNPTDNNLNGYIHFYNSSFSGIGFMYEDEWTDIEYSFVPSQKTSQAGYAQDIAYLRISTGIIDENSIVTVNEEIIDNTENDDTGDNTSNPSLTEAEKLELIKNWDAPIYDGNLPIFELSEEKAAMTNAACTPDDIYARYDALMAKHPQYITKTDLGLCSDGVNHVYRYDFKEPEPRHTSGYDWSETKAKAIIVSGIHYEWAGIYGLYYALEEIAENKNLRHLRRNTHLIVVPCMNPYATIADNYQGGLPTPNSQGVRNANGVEIHRNFEVGWVTTEAGTTHYGGTAPLSEVETQYVDNIMKNNTDAAFFLTCHSFGDTSFNFIWPSVATPYMCNMVYRLIDKLSNAWLEKHGDEFVGLEDYRTEDIPSWDNRLGFAHISKTNGTETRQATKYGIQGANVEICGRFWVHGTQANPEPSMSSFTMSRGAEVYVNFLLTAFGCYDPKDKKEYTA